MNMMKYVVTISISAIVAALLMPTAIGLIINATFPGADSTVTTMWSLLLPTFMVIGLALAFMPPEMKGYIKDRL